MAQSPLLVSLEQVRLMTLHSQGLIKSAFGKGKSGALSAIEQLGYVQIDTLSVAVRAHHHTLYSRLPDYKELFLNELFEKDKSVFEYWSHAASYLPMRHYRFSLPRKNSYAQGKSHWFAQDKKIKQYVLDRITAEGALQSKDFEHKRSGPGSWYEWKPAKRALEQLFMEGRLMVSRRQGFQKVYDLPVNVLPADVNTNVPEEKEYVNHLIQQAVNSNGIVEEKQIAYLRIGLKESINKEMKRMINEGELLEVNVEGFGAAPFITAAAHLKAAEKIKKTAAIHLLSPFDNAVIQRKRLLRFFNFDYQIECYLPEAKRKFGYFCLPVLYGNAFACRLDPKADRAAKIFYVKRMHFEKGFIADEKFNSSFALKLQDFAKFCGCEKVVIENGDKKWKKEITALF